MLFDTKNITQYKYQDSTCQKDKKYGWLSNHQFFFGFSSSASENIAGFPWAMLFGLSVFHMFISWRVSPKQILMGSMSHHRSRQWRETVKSV
jgi:hypothetical protein